MAEGSEIPGTLRVEAVGTRKNILSHSFPLQIYSRLSLLCFPSSLHTVFLRSTRSGPFILL
jgi:hypothetical protein